MNLPLTPLRFLRYAERQYPARTAIVCSGKCFTYAEFGDRVGRLAGALLSMGVQAGDRVAFLGTNTHRLLEAYYGVLEAGAILLPLNIRLSASELSYILKDAGAKVLFVDPQFIALVESFRSELSFVKVFCQLEEMPKADWLSPLKYDSWLERAESHRADFTSIDENSVAELFYTSGTSARPKGVVLTHRNVYLHALHACVDLAVRNGAVELHTIPLFHANGWGVAHYLTLLGGKHVMISHFEPNKVFDLIQNEGVQHFCVVPIMATLLVNHPERKSYNLSTLRRITIGGAAASATLIREVEEAFGCTCFAGYGLTETSPILSTSWLKEEHGHESEKRYEYQAMAGFAMPGVEMRIVDDQDRPLPENGEVCGELVARGDGVMDGYWNQPQATAEALRGGWFHTGDMAVINPEGYARIVDRKKDIIISGGENVSSLEVEGVLLANPAVLEACVIPRSHEQWGEVPLALIVLRSGGSLSESELIEFSRQRLAHYKCPRSVIFVDSLPKTGTGKVLKRNLRTQYG